MTTSLLAPVVEDTDDDLAPVARGLAASIQDEVAFVERQIENERLQNEHDNSKRSEIRSALVSCVDSVENLRQLTLDRLDAQRGQGLLDDESIDLLKRDLDGVFDIESDQEDVPEKQLAALPLAVPLAGAGYSAAIEMLIMLGILGAAGAAGALKTPERPGPPGNISEARRHKKKEGKADKSSGKKASDSGKNEKHGDGGRAEERAKSVGEYYEQRAREAPNKKERKELKRRKRRVIKNAQRKGKGEHHGQRGKKNR